MKRTYKKALTLVLAFYFLSFLITMNFVVIHESIHERIFEDFGYRNVSVSYGKLYLTGETTALPPKDISLEEHMLATEMNLWNEIIGYYLIYLVSWMFLFLFGYVTYRSFSEKDEMD